VRSSKDDGGDDKDCAHTMKQSPGKRQRLDGDSLDLAAECPSPPLVTDTARTLVVDTESETPRDNEESETPRDNAAHQRNMSTSSSVGSDLSYHESPGLRPPPVPPSTPASTTSSSEYAMDQQTPLRQQILAIASSGAQLPFDFEGEGAATPLPTYHRFHHTSSLLEQKERLRQQRAPSTYADFEGAATPAPSRRSSAMTPRHPNTEDEVMTPTSGAATVVAGRPGASRRSLPPPEDFSEWAVGDRYELLRMLGRGSYGAVAQAIDLSQGRRDAFVAIKRIQSPFDQEVDAVRLYREIHILRRMRGHECIIQLLDIVQPPTDDLDDFHDLYLVFECKDHFHLIEIISFNAISLIWYRFSVSPIVRC
jgi:Protein kinase domain